MSDRSLSIILPLRQEGGVTPPPEETFFYVDRQGNFYVDREGNYYIQRPD